MTEVREKELVQEKGGPTCAWFDRRLLKVQDVKLKLLTIKKFNF